VKERDHMMSLLQKTMMVLKCGDRSIRLRPPLTFSGEDADLAYDYIRKASTEL